MFVFVFLIYKVYSNLGYMGVYGNAGDLIRTISVDRNYITMALRNHTSSNNYTIKQRNVNINT